MSKIYSQNDEQVHIQRHFAAKGRTGGRFLDIGAYNGATFSNTLALVEDGWSGVCVEPSPHALRDLILLHRDRPQIEIVGCAVIPHGTESLFRFADCMGDAVSTLSEDHAIKWSSAVKFRDFLVQPISIARLLEAVGYDYDFVNIDVEGTNLELVAAFPWEKINGLSCVCIEHDSHTEEILDIFHPMGFSQLTWNAENIILAR